MPTCRRQGILRETHDIVLLVLAADHFDSAPAGALGASHTRAVLSSELLARRVPSGLKVRLVTPSVCPLSMIISTPRSTSQSRTVLSRAALASRLPSGLNVTAVIDPKCPL